MTNDGPRLGGFLLPRISTVVWATAVGSILGYYFYNRAVANIVAIVGAVVVTVVVVARDRAG